MQVLLGWLNALLASLVGEYLRQRQAKLSIEDVVKLKYVQANNEANARALQWKIAAARDTDPTDDLGVREPSARIIVPVGTPDAEIHAGAAPVQRPPE